MEIIFNLILLSGISSVIFTSCDVRNSAEINKNNSATVQPTVNVEATPILTADNSSNNWKSAKSNNSNSSVQTTEDEITSTPEKTVQVRRFIRL